MVGRLIRFGGRTPGLDLMLRVGGEFMRRTGCVCMLKLNQF